MGKIGKMKRALIGILVLASLCFLLIQAAPALLGLPFPLGGFMCDGGEKLCIKLTVAEPIKSGQPVNVTITVISLKDIPELHVNLSSWPFQDVTIDEEPGQPSSTQGGIAWTSSVQAYHRLTFTREIHLPLIDEEMLQQRYAGYALFDFKTSVWVEGHRPIGDGAAIVITSQGIQVYPWGERIPITPGPQPLVIPGPSPTFIPTSTLYLAPTP